MWRCEITTIQLTAEKCWPCDMLRTKCDDLGQFIPLPYAAYWVDPASPTRVLECLPGAACLEKYSEDEVRNRKCAPQRFQGIHTDPVGWCRLNR